MFFRIGNWNSVPWFYLHAELKLEPVLLLFFKLKKVTRIGDCAIPVRQFQIFNM